MEQEKTGRMSLKGGMGLIVAVVVVGILLIWLPAYRWFFLVSVLIGIGVAAILFFWHKYRPLKEQDVQQPKKPLGLD
jgi:MFS family permease